MSVVVAAVVQMSVVAAAPAAVPVLAEAEIDPISAAPVAATDRTLAVEIQLGEAIAPVSVRETVQRSVVGIDPGLAMGTDLGLVKEIDREHCPDWVAGIAPVSAKAIDPGLAMGTAQGPCPDWAVETVPASEMEIDLELETATGRELVTATAPATGASETDPTSAIDPVPETTSATTLEVETTSTTTM